jgi:hypothetical protein
MGTEVVRLGKFQGHTLLVGFTTDDPVLGGEPAVLRSRIPLQVRWATPAIKTTTSGLSCLRISWHGCCGSACKWDRL